MVPMHYLDILVKINYYMRCPNKTSGEWQDNNQTHIFKISNLEKGPLKSHLMEIKRSSIFSFPHITNTKHLKKPAPIACIAIRILSRNRQSNGFTLHLESVAKICLHPQCYSKNLAIFYKVSAKIAPSSRLVWVISTTPLCFRTIILKPLGNVIKSILSVVQR